MGEPDKHEKETREKNEINFVKGTNLVRFLVFGVGYKELIRINLFLFNYHRLRKNPSLICELIEAVFESNVHLMRD